MLRRRFIGEILRMTNGHGRVWLDFPNGAFPVDFWHGNLASGMRWHPPREAFLLTVREVARHVRAVADDRRWRVMALSPAGRLHFRRVRRHWYGRAFLAPVKLVFWAMRLPLLRRLAASPLNPYLVLEISPG